MKTDVQESVTWIEVQQDTEIQEVDVEAKNRLAEILTSLETRLSGKELVKVVRYELQEILAGRSIPEDKQIIHMDDFKKILYSPELAKKESRRILAGIAHRARLAVERSEEKARQLKRK